LADHYVAPYTGVFGPMPDISGLPAAGKPGDPAWDSMTAADQETINRIFSNYGKAIEAYERRLVSSAFQPSAFDRFLAGDSGALSPAAIRGRGDLHRTRRLSGVPPRPALQRLPVPQHRRAPAGTVRAADRHGRTAGIPVVMASVFNRSGAFSDEHGATDTTDLVATDGDLGSFKTPSLRNVSKTAPYMHDGAYGDLWDVVNHYNFGGETEVYSGERDPAINPLLLSDADLDNLIEFPRVAGGRRSAPHHRLPRRADRASGLCPPESRPPRETGVAMPGV